MAPMEGAAWSGCALYLTCVRQTIVHALAKSRHPVLILDLLPQMTRSGRGVRRAPSPRMKIDYVTSLSILEPWYLTFFLYLRVTTRQWMWLRPLCSPLLPMVRFRLEGITYSATLIKPNALVYRVGTRLLEKPLLGERAFIFGF